MHEAWISYVYFNRVKQKLDFDLILLFENE